MNKKSNYNKTKVYNGKFIKTFVLNETEWIDSSKKKLENPYQDKIDGKVVYYQHVDIFSKEEKKLTLREKFSRTTIFHKYNKNYSTLSKLPTLATHHDSHTITISKENLDKTIIEIEKDYGLNFPKKSCLES